MNHDVKKSVQRYIIGFSLSLVLTLGSFGAVMYYMNTGRDSLPHEVLILIVILFAIMQLVVQLVLFLHLGRETKPRWNLIVFLFMLLILIIIVAGSLWIMNNLNYNMMSPDEMKNYLNDNPGAF